MSKFFKQGSLYLLLVTLLAILYGCSAPPAGPRPAGNPPEAAAQSLAYPLEITDQVGRAVTISQVPQRIISLAPSNTEIVYALGLEDRLVGVTEYCDYPEAAKSKPKIGGFSTVNIEKVVEVQPDLVLASSIHKDKIAPQLERLGLNVLILDPKTIDDVLAAIRLVGQATGKTEEASLLTARMEQRVRAVTEKTNSLPESQRTAVLYLVWHDPLMAAGSGTLQDDLIAKAGGTNIARDLTDYAAIDLEEVIAANPGVMIAGGGHGSGQEAPFQYISQEARLKDTPARQDSRVYMVDANVVSRPGPRIVDGLEMFAEYIHPELFSAKQ